MQEKRTPIFQNEDGSWGHVTQTVNPLICTIEYSYNTGFPSKKEAEESYQKSLEAYSSQIQQLKKSQPILFGSTDSSLMEKAKISHALYHIVSVYFLEVCQATWHL